MAFMSKPELFAVLGNREAFSALMAKESDHHSIQYEVGAAVSPANTSG